MKYVEINYTWTDIYMNTYKHVKQHSSPLDGLLSIDHFQELEMRNLILKSMIFELKCPRAALILFIPVLFNKSSLVLFVPKTDKMYTQTLLTHFDSFHSASILVYLGTYLPVPVCLLFVLIRNKLETNTVSAGLKIVKHPVFKILNYVACLNDTSIMADRSA